MSHLPLAAPAATRACDQILGGEQLAHMHVSACWAVAHVSYMKVAYTGGVGCRGGGGQHGGGG